MISKTLNLLNQNKSNIFFVRSILEIDDEFLSLFLEEQEESAFELLPRKYIGVIKLENKFYRLDPFNFREISEEVLEFKKSISEYYPDEESYRFMYDKEKNEIYLDLDDLSGFNEFTKDSRKNLKEELWGKDE